ncbi:response regulator transcription factor [Mucilaginibacter paludis]|uniref:Response regulator receiver protein n=1 Tax=Mucilaginibacter paludis DSM 18603 TaxID=714943 RepID=H1Y367_9SPHI|nr:response regulator [Mucilaginibacter paludis]EHQ28885.1 response regulator receiver protein [Mucilaginibacter paludis DSM 18603]
MSQILVCDDEQEILDITRLILEDAGHQVIAVIDSGAVASLIEQEQPDVLLIDLWMPGLSGDQVVRQLRNNGSMRHIPIVVISASKEGKEIAYAAGADDFLEKPYDIDDLVAIVEKQLV